jgi:hypothetical protein
MLCKHGIYNASDKDGDLSSHCSRCRGEDGPLRSYKEAVAEKKLEEIDFAPRSGVRSYQLLEPVAEKAQDEIQFDPRMHTQENTNNDIRARFGTTEGVQPKKIRQIRKDIPVWAASQESILMHIVVEPTKVRFLIALRYWLEGWPAKDIAEDLGMSKNAVEMIIRKLSRQKPSDQTVTESL